MCWHCDVVVFQQKLFWIVLGCWLGCGNKLSNCTYDKTEDGLSTFYVRLKMGVTQTTSVAPFMKQGVTDKDWVTECESTGVVGDTLPQYGATAMVIYNIDLSYVVKFPLYQYSAICLVRLLLCWEQYNCFIDHCGRNKKELTRNKLL